MTAKKVLMCGIALCAAAALSSPAMAAKKHRHKPVDDQAAQTRELNQAQLESIQRAKTQGATTETSAAAAPGQAPNDEATPAADQTAEAKGQGGKLPDLQGASDQAKAEQQSDRAATQTTPSASAPGRSMALADVPNPKQTLAKMPIETKDGQKIGEVAQVVTDAGGKANVVVMTGQNNQQVHIGATKLTYMPDRKVLVSEVKPADLSRSTPATPPTPATPAPSAPESPTTTPQTPETPPTAPPPPAQ